MTKIILFLIFIHVLFLIHIVQLCEIQAPSSGQEQLKEERGFLKVVFKSQTNQIPKSLRLFFITWVKVPVGGEVVSRVGQHHSVFKKGEYRVHS